MTHGPVGSCTSASAGMGLQKCLQKAEGVAGAQRVCPVLQSALSHGQLSATSQEYELLQCASLGNHFLNIAVGSACKPFLKSFLVRNSLGGSSQRSALPFCASTCVRGLLRLEPGGFSISVALSVRATEAEAQEQPSGAALVLQATCERGQR